MRIDCHVTSLPIAAIDSGVWANFQDARKRLLTSVERQMQMQGKINSCCFYTLMTIQFYKNMR